MFTKKVSPVLCCADSFHSYFSMFIFTGVKKSAMKAAKIAVVITRYICMWLNISSLDQTSSFSFDGLSQ